MTNFDAPITDPPAPPEPRPPRRVSRVLFAGFVVVTLALGGAAYVQQDASTDRDEAERDRQHAVTQLHLQEDRTDSAESASRQARVAAREVSGEATMVVDIATPFVALGSEGLEAERAVQAVALDPEAVDQYNAAAEKADAVVDRYNAALDALLDRIDDLRGSLEA